MAAITDETRGIENATINDVQINTNSAATTSIEGGIREEVGKTTNKKRKPGSPGLYRRVDVPTPEMMVQEDFMNNCAVRTVMSGVMGSGLGVVFGIFMGTMDTSVCCLSGIGW